MFLGAFTGRSHLHIFARDIKADHDNAAEVSALRSMERKRFELLAKARETGASSLLIVSYSVLRFFVGTFALGGSQFVEGVAHSVLEGTVGWLALDGQWLDWSYARSRISVDVGKPQDGRVRITELNEVVWTASYPEEVLKRIPPFP